MLFKITSEKELLECFRPLDRDQVRLTSDLAFPLVVKDYLSWIEPSGHRVYLVFTSNQGQPPLGIVFERDSKPHTATTKFCDWCLTTRNGDAIGTLTATSSERVRVGAQLCRDLSCKDNVQESANPRSSTRRIIERMETFARRYLF